jgi:hypothetical protein
MKHNRERTHRFNEQLRLIEVQRTNDTLLRRIEQLHA